MRLGVNWIKHEPGRCPVPLDAFVVVVMEEDGAQLAPMQAKDIDWDCPGDQVAKYRRVNRGREAT